jgi:hypothetical protein
MKRLVVLLVVACVVAVICGCAGALNPGPSNLVAPASAVQPLSVDANAVGTWTEVISRKDGVDGVPKTVMNWPTGAVRHVDQLNSDGTCTKTYYNSAGTLLTADTVAGTWTDTNGTGTFDWGVSWPTTFSVTGNVLTLTWSVSGHTYQGVYAKVIALTAHDPALVGTWKVQYLFLNGESTAVSYLTGSTTYNIAARTLSANGISQAYDVDSTFDVEMPLAAETNWYTGGGIMAQTSGIPLRPTIYQIVSGRVETWQLDANGNTVRETLQPYGAGGNHDTGFLGQWHPTTPVTLNGKTVSWATIFGWDAGVTHMNVTFLTGGTALSENFKGTTLYSAALGTWATTVSGTTKHMALTFKNPMATTYVFNSATSVTLSWTDNAGAKVVTFITGW